jgi:hypothetical protein
MTKLISVNKRGTRAQIVHNNRTYHCVKHSGGNNRWQTFDGQIIELK